MHKLSTLTVRFKNDVTMTLSVAGMLTFTVGGLMVNFVVPINVAEEILQSFMKGSNKIRAGASHWSLEYVNGFMKFMTNNMIFRGEVKSLDFDGDELPPF